MEIGRYIILLYTSNVEPSLHYSCVKGHIAHTLCDVTAMWSKTILIIFGIPTHIYLFELCEQLKVIIRWLLNSK